MPKLLSQVELVAAIGLLLALLIVPILEDGQGVEIGWSPPLHIFLVHLDVFLVGVSAQIETFSTTIVHLLTHHSHLL